MFRQIVPFLLAVCFNWAAYSTGGIIVAIVTFWHSLRNKPVSKKLAIALALCFLLMAFFKAWDEQFEAAAAFYQELNDLTNPKLSAKIEAIDSADVMNAKECQAFLAVSVKNDGAPSVATSWQLSVTSSSVNVNRQQPTVIPDNFLLHDNGRLIARFHANNHLEEKTTVSAIQRGLPVSGWLRFDLPGITCTQFREGEKTLYFRDVNDVEYSATFANVRNLEAPVYFPGSGDNPFVVPPPKGKH
jgi:hypothetical protein